MATFEGMNWRGITALITLLTATGTGMAWTFRRAYKLGMSSQQLTGIQASIDKDIKPGIKLLEVRMDKKFEKVSERFDKVDERLNWIDEKFDKLEERFDKLYDLLLKKQ